MRQFMGSIKYFRNGDFKSLLRYFLIFSFYSLFMLTLIANPQSNSITPRSLSLTMSLEQNGDLVTGKKTVVIFFKSGNDIVWNERYNNVDFNNGHANFVLGQQNALWGDTFRVPSPNFNVSIELDQATINIHTVPFTIFANTVERIDWDQVKNFPNLNNFSSSLNLKDVSSLSGLFIGETTTDSGNFRLTVAKNAVISQSATTNITTTNKLNVSHLFQNNLRVINEFDQSSLFQLSQLHAPDYSLIITSANKWEAIYRDDVVELLDLDLDPNSIYRKIGIGIPTVNFDFSVSDSLFNVSKQHVRINNTTNPNPFSITQDSFNVIITQNSLLVNTDSFSPSQKSQLVLSGNVNVKGDIFGYADIANPEFNDVDFTVVQPKDSNYNSENVIIYKTIGDVGIGVGNPEHPVTLLRTLDARLDITPFSTAKSTAKTNDNLFSVRNAYGPFFTQYFFISNKNDGYKIGIHTDTPKGDFHISSRPYNHNIKDLSTFDTMVINQNKMGIGTTPNTSKLTITNPDSYPTLLVKGSTGFMVVSRNGSIGINVDKPQSALESKHGVLVGSSGIPSLGTIHINNGLLMGQANENTSVKLNSTHYWNLNRPHQYLDTAKMGIGTSTPSSAVHIVANHSPLTIETNQEKSLFINEKGFVGLTINPQGKLHVNGGMIIGFSDAKEEGTIRYNANPKVKGFYQGYTGTKWVALGQDHDWSYDPIHQSFYTKPNYKVGIMTKIPSATVHSVGETPLLVENKNNKQQFLVVTQNGYIGINTYQPSSLVQINQTLTQNAIFNVVKSNQDPIFKITNNGFIGIHHNSPKELLTINKGGLIINKSKQDSPGTVSFDTDRFIGYTPSKSVQLAYPEEWVLKNNNLSTPFNVGIPFIEDQNQLYLKSNNPLSINTLTTTHNIFIDTDGRLGINTHTPSATVHINTNEDPLIIDFKNNRLHLNSSHQLGINQTPRDSLDIKGSAIVNFTHKEIPGMIRFNHDKLLFEGFTDQWVTLSPLDQWTSNEQGHLSYHNGNIGIYSDQPKSALYVSGNLLINTPTQPNLFSISDIGHIGVGTQTPQSLFHINSNQEVLIDATGFVDPMFANEFEPESQTALHLNLGQQPSIGIGKKADLERLSINGAVVINTSTHQIPGTIKVLKDSFIGLLTDTTKPTILAQKFQWVQGSKATTNSKLYYNYGTVGIGEESSNSLFSIKGEFPVRINSNQQNNSLVVNPNGFVGIWNDNPSHSLHIKKDQVPFLVEYVVPPEFLVALDPETRKLQEKPVISLILDNNSNVGIATTNLIEKLTVDGAIIVSNSISTEPGTIAYDIEEEKFYTYLNNNLKRTLADVHQWGYYGKESNLFYENGFVGIGTMVPSNSLHIVSPKPLSVENSFKIDTNGSFIVGNTPSKATLTIHGDNPLKLSEFDHDVLTFNDKGQVAIMTEDFKETLSISNGLTAGKAVGTHPGTIDFSERLFGGYIHQEHIDLGHHVQWKLKDKNQYFSHTTIGMGLSNPDNRYRTHIKSNTPLSIQVEETNFETQQMEIIDSIYIDQQKIGFGLQHPTSLVHIKENSFRIENSHHDALLSFNNEKVAIGKFMADTALDINGSIRVSSSQTTLAGEFNFNNNIFSGFTNQNSRVDLGRTDQWKRTNQNLYSDNNIGIYTNDPLASLHVHTKQNSLLMGSQQHPKQFYINAMGLTMINTNKTRATLTISGNIRIKDNSLIINKDSNFIGLNELDPKESIHNQGAVIVNDPINSNSGTIYFNDTTNRFLGKTNSDWVSLARNNEWLANQNDIFYQVPEGRVGINHQQPSTNLHIVGSFGLSKSNNQLLFVNNGKVSIGHQNPLSLLHIKHNTPVRIDSNSINHTLYINNQGLIGLGTSSPASRLDINGGIKFSDLSVTQQPYSTKAGTLYYDGQNVYGYISDNVKRPISVPYKWKERHNNTILNNMILKAPNLDTAAKARLDIMDTFLVESATMDPIFIVTDNKVAIGTALPNARLHINAENPLLIDVDNTTAQINVTKNGFLGINTLNPTSYLHITATTNLAEGALSPITIKMALSSDQNPINNVGNAIRFTHSVPDGDELLGTLLASQTNNTGHFFLSSSQSKGITLLNNNRIGMGNREPKSDLFVSSHLAFDSQLSELLMGYNVYDLDNPKSITKGSSSFIKTDQSTPFSFKTGTSTADNGAISSQDTLTILSSGLVGFNYNSPKSQLDISVSDTQTTIKERVRFGHFSDATNIDTDQYKSADFMEIFMGANSGSFSLFQQADGWVFSPQSNKDLYLNHHFFSNTYIGPTHTGNGQSRHAIKIMSDSTSPTINIEQKTRFNANFTYGNLTGISVQGPRFTTIPNTQLSVYGSNSKNIMNINDHLYLTKEGYFGKTNSNAGASNLSDYFHFMDKVNFDSTVANYLGSILFNSPQSSWQANPNRPFFYGNKMGGGYPYNVEGNFIFQLSKDIIFSSKDSDLIVKSDGKIGINHSNSSNISTLLDVNGTTKISEKLLLDTTNTFNDTLFVKLKTKLVDSVGIKSDFDANYKLKVTDKVYLDDTVNISPDTAGLALTGAKVTVKGKAKIDTLHSNQLTLSNTLTTNDNAIVKKTIGFDRVHTTNFSNINWTKGNVQEYDLNSNTITFATAPSNPSNLILILHCKDNLQTQSLTINVPIGKKLFKIEQLKDHMYKLTGKNKSCLLSLYYDGNSYYASPILHF
ncbi:hypothetical protein DID75_02720 [Candidatus Marinamargulisbacteria bacterium SCGC AG-410-N11]|nr:hypothetical protein DID75_02720 [Candidatus Marinamargulisbacteria bacterium SCGC AG-410-N11]